MITVNLMIIGSSAVRGCWYALGMTLAYGALGLAAATGFAAFGAIQSNAWFNLAAGAVFSALAAALAGFWTLDFAGGRSALAGKIGNRGGFLFPLTMGALSAVLAGACVAPVLVAFLVLTADLYAKGETTALALPFAIGLGMALPWPFAAAGMKVLPRPGAWMKWVNRVLALTLAAMAVRYFKLSLAGFGVFAAGAGGEGVESVTPAEFPAALERASRPVLVDCWASWCKNCAAMEKVIGSEKVRLAIKDFTLIRLQAEDIGELRRLKGFEGIKGLPAFVIFE
jgi:thiol:disulfide interchange protein